MWSKGNSEILIIALYIDDLIFIKNNEKMVENFRKEMSDMGLLPSYI